jgi:ketosteroid isomerase-like protein
MAGNERRGFDAPAAGTSEGDDWRGDVMPDAESVATECLQGWTTGDFETAGSLIEEDIGFVGPFGAAEGADAYLSGLRRFRARGVQGVDIHRVFSDGDDVCIIYDLVTTMAAGTIPSAGWYRLRDGKIASVRAFVDARRSSRRPGPRALTRSATQRRQRRIAHRRSWYSRPPEQPNGVGCR